MENGGKHAATKQLVVQSVSQQLQQQHQRVGQQSSSSSADSSSTNNNSSSSSSSIAYTLPKNMMMSRGFSEVQANQDILNETRTHIEQKFLPHNSSHQGAVSNGGRHGETNESSGSSSLAAKANFVSDPGGIGQYAGAGELTVLNEYSFMLPNLNKIEDYKFRQYLQNDLIEMPTEYSLTESGHLNWWTTGDWEDVCRHLYPMVTSGDGNCLLHAASLAMWGLHDRHLLLRRALHSALEQLKPDNSSPLWRRWKWEQMCQNRKYGLIYNDDEWLKEWQSLLKLSSYQPRISHSNSSSNKFNAAATNNSVPSAQQQQTPTHSSHVASVRASQPLPLTTLEEMGAADQSIHTITGEVRYDTKGTSSTSSISSTNKSDNNNGNGGAKTTAASSSVNSSSSTLHLRNGAGGVKANLNNSPTKSSQEVAGSRTSAPPAVNSPGSSTNNSLSGDDHNNNNNGSGSGNNQDENVYFESLEEFHVFLLANILRRPIIIVSDTMLHDLDGEPLAPIPFGGIYLPLECDVNKCNRYPLVLAYDSAHFSALVLMDDEEFDVDVNDDQHQHQQQQQHESEVARINNLLQVRPPYSIVPITYSNNELLPFHFAHDPGEDYDWSSFPTLSQQPAASSTGGQLQLTNLNQAADDLHHHHRHQQPQPAVSKPKPPTNEEFIELTRDQKMFLLQRYLDVVKLQLYDPGPIKRLNINSKKNIAINTSGMCVNVSNVRVLEPLISQSSSTPSLNNGAKKSSSGSGGSGSGSSSKNAKAAVNSKLQKFINIFKKDSSNSLDINSSSSKGGDDKSHSSSSSNDTYKVKGGDSGKSSSSKHLKAIESGGGGGKQSPLSNSRSAVLSSNGATTTSSSISSLSSNPYVPTNRAIHHTVLTLKSWNALFDSAYHHTVLMCVKLNLAKPPKFKRMINNYLISSKQKFDQLQYEQVKQQQQQLPPAQPPGGRLQTLPPPPTTTTTTTTSSSYNRPGPLPSYVAATSSQPERPSSQASQTSRQVMKPAGNGLQPQQQQQQQVAYRDREQEDEEEEDDQISNNRRYRETTTDEVF